MKKNVLTKSAFAALLLASTVVAAEEQYPAADFQPTVIYSDAGATTSSSANSTANSNEGSATEEKVAEKAESSNTMLFGIAALAIAGGVFLSRKPKKCGGSKSSCASHADVPVSASADGSTGVERYLQARNASAATGVEKYLAKKELIDQEASLTGVDRYLRDRG